MGIFKPHKIPEADNCADMNTKYLRYDVWLKHVLFALNLTKARMAKAEERMHKIMIKDSDKIV